jgi:hypothetical protein
MTESASKAALSFLRFVWWLCSLVGSFPLLLGLGILKRKHKPSLDKYLFMIAEFKLEWKHPITIMLMAASVLFGIGVLLLAISTSFHVLKTHQQCVVLVRVLLTSLVLGHSFILLVLIERARSTMTVEVRLKNILEYLFRPLVIILAVFNIALPNLERNNTIIFQEVSGQSLCFFYFHSFAINLVFIGGDILFSFGLFFAFYVQVRRVSRHSKGVRIRSVEVEETDDLDAAVVRNFKSFLFMWLGTIGTHLIFSFSGAVLEKNIVAGALLYSLLLIAGIFLSAGVHFMIWKAYDFETTIYSCWKKKKKREVVHDSEDTFNLTLKK